MNFYALSTPPGVSGIAIIRVSGNTALETANQITREPIQEDRTALLRKLYDRNGSLIDEGIVIWYPENKSYTGQNLIEFHVHGSKAVIDKLLSDLSEREDCRIAEPGEFTKTAYRNNKINLYEAESIADLLDAETEDNFLRYPNILLEQIDQIHVESLETTPLAVCNEHLPYKKGYTPTNKPLCPN